MEGYLISLITLCQMVTLSKFEQDLHITSNDYDLYFNSIRFKGSPTGSTTTTINTGTSEITVKSGELSNTD